jgi:hypothetical protein
MLRDFNEEFLAVLAARRDPAAEVVSAAQSDALLRELGATTFEGKLFAHPVLFDRAELDALGRAGNALLSAQVKILRHLRAHHSDAEVLDLFAIPRRLAPYMRWENLDRPEETVARLDIIPTRTGYSFCELNVFPGVGCGEAYPAGQLYLRGQRLPEQVIASLPIGPLPALAAMYAEQARRQGLTRVVILESVSHGALGYPRQELLQRALREQSPELTVEILDEQRYPEAWLTRAEGERTLIHRMFTYREVSDDFAFFDRLWQSGAHLAGFESELRMSKRFLAMMGAPEYRALLSADELAAIERHLPPSYFLTEARLAQALRDREQLVFKWDESASYGGTGVLIGAEHAPAALEEKLRAAGVEHWICQRVVEAETLPLRATNDAEPADYRIVLGLYCYGGTCNGMIVRGSRASRVVNVSSVSGRMGWAFATSEEHRRALIEFLKRKESP